MSTRRSFLHITLLSAALAASLPLSAAVDPRLLALVPGDATVLSGVNVDTAKTSAYGRYMLGQMTVDDAGFQKFIADTGFDPRRDLSQILSATSGDSTSTKTVVVGRGIFNPGKIANASQAEGAKLLNYKGVDLVVHSGTDMMGAIAFLDATTAALGYLDAVKAVIDRRALTTPALPATVVTRITALAAANDGWFLSTVSPATFFTGKIDNPKVGGMLEAGLMQSVVAGSGGLKFTATGATIGAQAVARSDKDATALADVMRFLVNIAQSSQGTSPEAAKFASMLDTMQVTTQGATMNLLLNIPEATLEQLFMGSHGKKERIAGIR